MTDPIKVRGPVRVLLKRSCLLPKDTCHKSCQFKPAPVETSVQRSFVHPFVCLSVYSKSVQKSSLHYVQNSSLHIRNTQSLYSLVMSVPFSFLSFVMSVPFSFLSLVMSLPCNFLSHCLQHFF